MAKKSKKENSKKITEKAEQNFEKQKECDCEELTNLYHRALADYQNLLKRQSEEKEKTIAYANESLILKLLDVYEALEKSQKHLKNEGIQKVLEKLKKILDEEQVTEIDPDGQDFDPEFHEAIENTSGKAGKILKVHRKGYKLVNKVIRPAMVSVGNGQK